MTPLSEWSAGVLLLRMLYSRFSLSSKQWTLKKGNGLSNIGRVSDPELDALIEKIKQEENFDKRNELIEQALLRVNKNIYVLPLHTQVINWALKKNIEAPLRADDRLELDKVIVK